MKIFIILLIAGLGYMSLESDDRKTPPNIPLNSAIEERKAKDSVIYNLIDDYTADKLKDSIPSKYDYWIIALNGKSEFSSAHDKILIDLKEDSRYNSENKFTFLQEYRCTKCHITNE